MIRKIYEAETSNLPTVTMWGDGTPYREFLHVDDLAEACIFLMQSQNYNPDKPIINVGSGIDISLKELAEFIAWNANYNGAIIWDTTKPNGTPRKLLDVSYINSLGWKAKKHLVVGVRQTYDWYKDNVGRKR